MLGFGAGLHHPVTLGQLPEASALWAQPRIVFFLGSGGLRSLGPAGVLARARRALHRPLPLTY